MVVLSVDNTKLGSHFRTETGHNSISTSFVLSLHVVAVSSCGACMLKVKHLYVLTIVSILYNPLY